MCWGCICGSYTFFLWKTRRVALGAFWPTVGEMDVTILSSAEPHCPPCPWQALPCLCPSDPRWEGRPWCSVFDSSLLPACFLIHGPGLSCFAFISSCSPISLSIYKPYFYAVWADLDMKLTCCMILNSLGILLFLFFP